MKKRTTRNQPGLTLGQHLTLAQYLKVVQEELAHIAVETGNAYALNSDVHKLACKAEDAVQDLRRELDNQLFKDHGDIDEEQLKLVYGNGGKDTGNAFD